MSQPITFRSGQSQEFIATRTFDLGQSGLKALAGVPILFDGTYVSVEGHPPLMLPNLRGAIRMGWLVLAGSFDPNAAQQRPLSAGVQMRPAEGGNPMEPKPRHTITTNSVEAEEREVANVQQHATHTAQRNQVNYRASAEAEGQDGVVVRRVTTPAQWAPDDLERVSIDAAIRKVEATKIVAGAGRSREDVMAQMEPEARAQYVSELAARMAVHDPDAAARIVASVAGPGVQSRDGVAVKGSVGGGTAIEDLGGTGIAGPAQMTSASAEGIAFRNTNGPGTVKRASALAAGPEGQARQIARSICPDFPDNYVFGDTVRRKIARLQADFEDRPDVIRAVAAADTDPEVRSRLVEEFPQAFGG